jgi:hypothetical protein
MPFLLAEEEATPVAGERGETSIAPMELDAEYVHVIKRRATLPAGIRMRMASRNSRGPKWKTLG